MEDNKKIIKFVRYIPYKYIEKLKEGTIKLSNEEINSSSI